MIKRLYFFLLLLSFGLDSKAQDTSDHIAWSKRKLQWEDFQEQLPYRDKYPNAAAKTRWLFYFNIDDREYILAGKPIKITVIAFFDPSLSWVRNGARTPRRVLDHEQLHFDLVEISARQLRKEILESSWDSLTYRQQLQELYQKINGQLNNIQRKYDDATSHGTNFITQTTWAENIEAMIEETVAYSRRILRISISPIPKHEQISDPTEQANPDTEEPLLVTQRVCKYNLWSSFY